jgi:hypothetical protein
MDRWGQYFKPAGMGQATGDPVGRSNTPAPVAKAVAAPVEEAAPWDDEEAAPVAKTVAAPKAATTEASGESASRAQDILAMIRNRQK